nr:hypothetical protein [Tanacetum cinerariifolium]
MKREGKSFYGIITHLFATMMVQAPEDMGEGSEVPTDTYHTPIVTQPSTSQPQKMQKSRRKQRKETEVPHTEPQTKESVPTTSNDPLPSGLGDQDDASKQGRITEIDADEDLSLIDETAQDQGRLNEEDMFGVDDLDGDEVIMDVTTGENVEQDATIAEKEVSTADPVTNVGEVVTTAKGVEAKDKGKGIMVELKKPLKKKDQIALDEEVARKLEAQMKAKMEEEERIAREKDEANIVVVE